MGIFSSEYEYFAFSQTQALIGDEDKVNTLGTFVASAARNEDENIPPNIIAATVAGMPGTAKQYYKYGKNDYYWGLPHSNFYSFTIDNEAIQKVIGADKTIIQTYAPLGNSYLYTLDYLHKTSWWDIQLVECVTPLEYIWGGTNSEFAKANPYNFTVKRNVNYPKYIDITFPVTWNTAPPSQFRPDEYVTRIEYTGKGEILTGLWTIYAYTHQIMQPQPSGWDTNRYWPPRYDLYDTYPSAQFPVVPINKEKAEFYPIAVFRRGYTDYKSNKEWEKTLQKLLYKLTVDADEVYEEFEEAIANSEASKAELNEFYIGYMLNIEHAQAVDYKEPAHKYLYEMVKELFLTNAGDRQAYINYLTNYDEWLKPPEDSEGRQPRPPQRGMGVQETDREGGFWYSLSWSFIEKYTSYISHDDAKRKFVEFDPDAYDGPNAIFPPYASDWVDGVEILGDGSEEYVSYLFFNSESQYYVNSPDGYISARPEGGKWCPMSPELVKRMPFADQDRILQDGLCAVIYTLVEQEIKWYSTNFWQGVILLITFTVGVYVSLVGFKGIMAATGLLEGSVGYAIASYIVKFAIGSILQVGFTLGGLDPTAAALLTGFLTIARSMNQMPGATTKQFLLGNKSKIYNVGKVLLNSTDTKHLIDEQEDYAQSEKDKQDELDDGYLGMVSARISDPHLDLSRRLDDNDIFESPSEFMGRTTNINPGRAVLELPANFVNQSLQLPRGMNDATIIDVMA